MFFPLDSSEMQSSYHTFVIQCKRRDELKQYLADIGIKTSIHYPVPIHLQQAATTLNCSQGDFPVAESQALKILTLPINQYMKKSELESVAKEVNYFFDSL